MSKGDVISGSPADIYLINKEEVRYLAKYV